MVRLKPPVESGEAESVTQDPLTPVEYGRTAAGSKYTTTASSGNEIPDQTPATLFLLVQWCLRLLLLVLWWPIRRSPYDFRRLAALPFCFYSFKICATNHYCVLTLSDVPADDYAVCSRPPDLYGGTFGPFFLFPY